MVTLEHERLPLSAWFYVQFVSCFSFLFSFQSSFLAASYLYKKLIGGTEKKCHSLEDVIIDGQERRAAKR